MPARYYNYNERGMWERSQTTYVHFPCTCTYMTSALLHH
uniref:Uncharacterized protein n=1 Tax=Arundo donax TaxID=35708 RepID=A0A0A8YJL0_ARUDO